MNIEQIFEAIAKDHEEAWYEHELAKTFNNNHVHAMNQMQGFDHGISWDAANDYLADNPDAELPEGTAFVVYGVGCEEFILADDTEIEVQQKIMGFFAFPED